MMTIPKQLTKEEARSCLGEFSEDQLVELLREHHYLKQSLCEHVLGVATGNSDWTQRAVIRAQKRERLSRLLVKAHAQLDLLSEEIREALGRSTG